MQILLDHGCNLLQRVPSFFILDAEKALLIRNLLLLQVSLGHGNSKFSNLFSLRGSLLHPGPDGFEERCFDEIGLDLSRECVSETGYCITRIFFEVFNANNLSCRREV